MRRFSVSYTIFNSLEHAQEGRPLAMTNVQDGPHSHNGRARHERNLHYPRGRSPMETHVCIGHGLGRETLAKPVPDGSTRACALRIMILAMDMMLNKQQGVCIVGPGSSCLLLLGQAATMHQMTHFPVPTGRHGRSLLRPQSLGRVPTVIVCQEWNCPAAWQASLPILGFPMTLV